MSSRSSSPSLSRTSSSVDEDRASALRRRYVALRQGDLARERLAGPTQGHRLASAMFPPVSAPPSAPELSKLIDAIPSAYNRDSPAGLFIYREQARKVQAFVAAETRAVTEAAKLLETSAPLAERSALERWTDATDALAERAICAWDLLTLANDAATIAEDGPELSAKLQGSEISSEARDEEREAEEDGSLPTVPSDEDMATPDSPQSPLRPGAPRPRSMYDDADIFDVNAPPAVELERAFSRFDPAVLALSDAYAAIRAAMTPTCDTPNDVEWSPPSTFERKTTKYWIKPKDVLRVKLAACKHLPVLVFGDKKSSGRDGGAVSSVYFDNDQLDVYRTRMERHEGSTLVRVRWYGDVDGHGVPHEDTPRVFIERKTHHESWSVESSVKERFRLDGTDLFKYIDGYLLASPDLNAQAATLARDVSNDELRARGLKPSVGSFYNRTAFQRSDSNDVRVSLDVDLRFSDAANADVDPFIPTKVHGFPMAILEVKLARGEDGEDGAPDWIDEVLSAGDATEVKKFSKFLHATAVLRAEAGGADVALPHWYGAETLEDDDRRAIAPQVKEDHVCVDIDRPRHLAGGVKVSPLAGAISNLTPPASTTPTARAPFDGHVKAATSPSRRRHVPVKVEPKTFFANERTLLQWLSMSILILFMSLALLSLDGGGGLVGTAEPVVGNGGGGGGIGAASTLGPVGGGTGGLSGAAATSRRHAVASGICGAILAPVAIVFMVYSLWIFVWRARRIARREPSARYDDRWGPVALVVMLVGISCAAVTLAIVSHPW